MAPHFWLRAEDHNNEHRSPITPKEAAALMQAGARLTVEHSPERACLDADFAALGCEMAKTPELWISGRGFPNQ